MIEWIGWIGSAMLAVCGVPQALKSIRDKHSDGMSWGFLLLWFFGEVLCLVYIIPLGAWPLYLNYAVNVMAVSVILYYKIKTRNRGSR